MRPSPRVTVVIPTHNRPALLAEALESIRLQTFDDWEAIVADDGSNPPASVHVLDEKSSKKFNIVRNATPKGGPTAKNLGAHAGHAEIIAFLDDDDLYSPEYLERAIHVLDHYPEIDVVFMGVSWFGANAKWGENVYQEAMKKTLNEAKWVEREPGVILFDEALVGALLSRVPMAFQRPVVRRRAFEAIGGYREDCLLWDCDWATRAALQVPTALLTQGVYRQRAENQGYSSKKERHLDHLLSGVEIRERLLKWVLSQEKHKDKSHLFREALAKGLFDVAFFHYQSGCPSESMMAWWKSQKCLFKAGRMKLLVRILWSAMPLGQWKARKPG